MKNKTRLTGIMLLIIGSMACWFFLPQTDYSFLESLGETRQDQAIITGLVESDFSRGHGRRKGRGGGRGTKIYGHEFEFTDVSGEVIKGVSYTKGKKGSVGSQLPVEIPVKAPHRAVLMGMRRKPVSSWVTLVAALPIMGLCILIRSIRKG